MVYYLKRFCLQFLLVFIFAINGQLTAKSENYLGNNNAKVTIIEYASMTCKHCADFHRDVFPKIKDKYITTGKVKFIFNTHF